MNPQAAAFPPYGQMPPGVGFPGYPPYAPFPMHPQGKKKDSPTKFKFFKKTSPKKILKNNN